MRTAVVQVDLYIGGVIISAKPVEAVEVDGAAGDSMNNRVEATGSVWDLTSSHHLDRGTNTGTNRIPGSAYTQFAEGMVCQSVVIVSMKV